MDATAGSVGLRIKSKIMKVMTDCLQTVSLIKGPTDEVEEFTYLGSVVSTTRGSEQDVEARLGKATTFFRAMDKLWKSKPLEGQLK